MEIEQEECGTEFTFPGKMDAIRSIIPSCNSRFSLIFHVFTHDRENFELNLGARMAFCGGNICSDLAGANCGLGGILYSNTCVNHFFVMLINVLLVFSFFLNFAHKVSCGVGTMERSFWSLSPVRISSLIFSG